jgi:hypothetical protein
MGNMKVCGLIGFERWGNLRPAYMHTEDGRCFVPVCLGLWRRSFKGDKLAPDVSKFTPYPGND